MVPAKKIDMFISGQYGVDEFIAELSSDPSKSKEYIGHQRELFEVSSVRVGLVFAHVRFILCHSKCHSTSHCNTHCIGNHLAPIRATFGGLPPATLCNRVLDVTWVIWYALRASH